MKEPGQAQGLGRNVTLLLAGWLWADLLLGLYAFFTVANTVVPPDASPTPTPTPAATATPTPMSTPTPTPRVGVDRNSICVSVTANGPVLLGQDSDARDKEQTKIRDETMRQLVARAGPQVTNRRVAMVLAFGWHSYDPNVDWGQRVAERGTAKFTTGVFQDALVRPFGTYVQLDPGSRIDLEIFFFEDIEGAARTAQAGPRDATGCE